jgi:hypothetical protein
MYVCMHSPGIEPGTSAWKADILPLNYECCEGVYLFFVKSNEPGNWSFKKNKGVSLQTSQLLFTAHELKRVERSEKKRRGERVWGLVILYK